MRDGHLNDYAW